MPTGAAIAVSAIVGGGASLIAGGMQASAADRATAAQLDMFNKQQAKLEPYAATGKSAMTTLASLYGLDPNGGGQTGQAFNPGALDAFTRSPDYAFTLAEGVKARDASAASKGGLLSGGQLQEITKYGQGLASTQFGNYVGRLQALAGAGQNAAAGQGAGALTVGSQVASNTMGAANGIAAGVVGAGNAAQNGITNYLKNSSAYASPTGGALASYPYPTNGVTGLGSGQPLLTGSNGMLAGSV